MVEGHLPDALRGDLVRAGPMAFSRSGVEVQHAFEADGYTSSVRLLGDGRAWHHLRLVESEAFRVEEAADRFHYFSLASRPRRMLNGLLGLGKNTGNTALHWHSGTLLSLNEAALPLEIDPDTLATLGTRRLGALKRAFSAHPVFSPHHGMTFGFGQVWLPYAHLDVFTLPPGGEARKLGSVPLGQRTMVHDFKITRRFALFVVGPSHLVVHRALTQWTPFHTWFRWDATGHTRVLAMELAHPERVLTFDLPPLWSWHQANAFELGDDIVLDLSRYDDTSNLDRMATGEPLVAPFVRRFVLGVGDRTVREEALREQRVEFPAVHPAVVGQRHRFIWGKYVDEQDAEGISRYDTLTGQLATWSFGRGGDSSEPVVVPRPSGREDDVWVLVRAFSPRRQEHFVAVFDGHGVEDGPIARIWLGDRLPATFHGVFLPRT